MLGPSSAATAKLLVHIFVILLQYNCAANSHTEKAVKHACRDHQFACRSGTCVEQSLLCNGLKDCADGSDENTDVCENFKCPDAAFRCDYGACVNKEELCNGVQHCADGSDEKPEICNRTIKRRSTPGGCKLPPQPENGQYKLSGCEPPSCNPVPGTIVDSAYINYTCNPGSSMAGSKVIICIDGWSSDFPTCSRSTCGPLIDPSREMKCTLNGRDVDCNTPVASGTRATVRCDKYYTTDAEFYSFDTECQGNGKWSREVKSCSPKCGEQVPSGVPFSAHGAEVLLGEYPWYASVYIPVYGKLEHHCGGTIISERIIVTAATCFWDDNTSAVRNFREYRIAVGKSYRDWNHTTSYIQTPEIYDVIIHKKFRGLKYFYRHNIALIILKSKITMTPAVQPVCIDYDERYSYLLSAGQEGVVVGWDITETMKPGERLSSTTLDYGDEACEREPTEVLSSYFTIDKFCIEQENGANACPGDSGGGYATLFRDGRWYLQGVVTVGTSTDGNERCKTYRYLTVTKLSEYNDFLLEHRNTNKFEIVTPTPEVVQPSTPIGCTLPRQPENGEFLIEGCGRSCLANPGSTVKHGTILTYGCNQDFTLTESAVVSCNNGSWSPSPPSCKRRTGLCPPLKNPSRIIYCTHLGSNVDCANKGSQPETRASVSCRPFYENVPGLETYDMLCNSSGYWSKELQSCTPKCGDQNPRGHQFISGGYTPTSQAEFPWHVGFYLNRNETLTPSCGGTIVAPRIIISAAHCFWSNGQIETKKLKVVAGKYFYDWNKTTKYVQHLEIENVVVHDRYQGEKNNFENDIAIVILKTEILINEAVRPACLDFYKSYERKLSTNTVGKLVGWGLTENGTNHETLRAASLPFIDADECEKAMPTGFHHFITYDKFCAGNRNKTTACAGDSGGGYTVEFQERRWYLVGIVSTGPADKCGQYPYAAYTNVYKHVEFIRQYYFIY